MWLSSIKSKTSSLTSRQPRKLKFSMQAYFNPTRRNMNQKSVGMQAYFNPTRRNMKVKIGLIIKLATFRFLGWRPILNSLSIQRNFSNCPMNDIFSGCNRMRTMEDLELHFGVEALRVFRFL